MCAHAHAYTNTKTACHGVHIRVREELVEEGFFHTVWPRDGAEVSGLCSKHIHGPFLWSKLKFFIWQASGHHQATPTKATASNHLPKPTQWADAQMMGKSKLLQKIWWDVYLQRAFTFKRPVYILDHISTSTTDNTDTTNFSSSLSLKLGGGRIDTCL